MGARALGAGGYAAPRQSGSTKGQPRIDRRAVLCPDCKAEAGVPCTTVEGKPMTGCHRARVRMATRHHMEKRTQDKEIEL